MLWVVGACGLGLLGCHASEHNKLIPPAKPVEEYVIPPEDDPHWSKPPTYPSDTLNQPMQKPNNGLSTANPNGSNAPSTSFGPARNGGPGMSGGPGSGGPGSGGPGRPY
jgi:hypothetical protein